MTRFSVEVGPITGLAILALVVAAGPRHASAQDAYNVPEQEAMQAMLNDWSEDGGAAADDAMPEAGTESGAADDAEAMPDESAAPRAAEQNDVQAASETRCGLAVTIVSGDTLSKIARRCDTSVEALLDANSHLDDPHRISVGTTVTIPGADTSMPRYVVGPGDTLASIAGELRLPAQALAEANPDVDPAGLSAGVVLRVPPDWADDFDAGEGPVSMTGVITTVQCPAMRGPDGRLYALAGVVEQFQPGDRVEVQGERGDASWCVPGAAIEIGEIRPSG